MYSKRMCSRIDFLMFTSCAKMPKGAEPGKNFQKENIWENGMK